MAIRMKPVLSLLLLLGTALPAFAQESVTFQPARKITAEEIAMFPTVQFERFHKEVHKQGPGDRVEPNANYTPPVPTDVPGAARAFGYQARLAKSFQGHQHSGSPADPHIAAGPDHLVTMVNFQVAFWDKQGNNLLTAPLDSIFGIPGGALPGFDPKVIYDRDSGRFFLLALSTNKTTVSNFHLAVSVTSNPMDGFYAYPALSNLHDAHWLDYPTLGVGEGALYFGGILIGDPDAYKNSIWIIDKTPLLSGLAANGWVYNDTYPIPPGSDILLMKAAVTWNSPVGTLDNFLVSWNLLPGKVFQPVVWGVSLPAGFPTDLPVWSVQMAPESWASPGVPNAIQPGGEALVKADNMGANLMNAVYRNGKLWTVSNFGGVNSSDLRLMSFDVSGWPSMSLSSTQLYGNSVSYYYWPAVAANGFGDVVTTFSRSNSTEFASARWAKQFRSESGLTSSQYLKVGEDYYGEPADTDSLTYRWGDYGGACVDPESEGFWIMHKYAAPRSIGASRERNYATWIGYVPRAVFVDASNPGAENGSRPYPYQDHLLGYLATLPGNDFVIRTGNYPAGLTMSKPLTIIPDGGPVTIGE